MPMHALFTLSREVRSRLLVASVGAGLATAALAAAAPSADAYSTAWYCGGKPKDTQCLDTTGASQYHSWKNIRVTVTDNAVNELCAKVVNSGGGVLSVTCGHDQIYEIRMCRGDDSVGRAYSYWNGSGLSSGRNMDNAAATLSDTHGVCGIA